MSIPALRAALNRPGRDEDCFALDVDQHPGIYELVREQAQRRNRLKRVLLRPLGNVIYIAPPLNISDGDLDELLGKVREAIEEVLKG